MNCLVDYFLNKATETAICNHLSACDSEFVKKLQERVDITEYGKKIYNKAVRFEAWFDNTLIGLVAAYCNDQTKHMAYITSVSVLNKWQGKGIAAQLISRCIEHAEGKGMQCVSLEVAIGNTPAIGLYEKLGFVVTDTSGSLITMNLITAVGKSKNFTTTLNLNPIN